MVSFDFEAMGLAATVPLFAAGGIVVWLSGVITSRTGRRRNASRGACSRRCIRGAGKSADILLRKPCFPATRRHAALAAQTGIGESFTGATLVSITTSLPELSATFTAVRLGAFSMATGNIPGTNILEMALFLPADVLYRGGPIFAALEPSAIFLTALGIVVTPTAVFSIRM